MTRLLPLFSPLYQLPYLAWNEEGSSSSSRDMRFFPPPGAICNHGLLHTPSPIHLPISESEEGEGEREIESADFDGARVTLLAESEG